MDSGGAFEAGMKDILLRSMKKWQEEFTELISKPSQAWQEKLRGQTQRDDHDSGSAEYYNDRGIAAAKQNQYENAISEFTRAIKRNQTFADAYYNRGLVYLAIGQETKAISDFTKVIQINPDFIDGYMNRGDLYLQNDEYEKAISDFTQVIEIDSGYAEAYFGRLLVYFALGDYDKAWDNVYKIEALDCTIPSEFLTILQRVSKR
jgi:tetratricopeptide (TPR) repeat protein